MRSRKASENGGVNVEIIPYIVQYLSTASLVSGLPYQRPVEEKDVNKLIQEWDGRLLEPVVVSFRNRRYYLVDGQHRVIVLRRLNGDRDLMVPCKVYQGLTYEMEAELCFKLDKSRKKLTLAQSTIALAEAGTDAEVMEIIHLIESNGFLWTLDKEFTGNYEIRACRAVISAYRLLGSEAFDRMLFLISCAWQGQPGSLKGNFITGMALFLKTYGMELENRAAIQYLSAIDPEDVLRSGRQDCTTRHSAVRYARALLGWYNTQCRPKLADRYKD